MIRPNPRLQVHIAEQLARAIVCAPHNSAPIPACHGEIKSRSKLRREPLLQQPAKPPEPLHSDIAHATIAALSEIVYALAPLDAKKLDDVWVKGGGIVAWGKTDIDDPQSELHKRYEIGIQSRRRYHSVDPGKLTMAPYFAEECAARIVAAA